MEEKVYLKFNIKTNGSKVTEMKKLIIGKNSRIVKEISPFLHGFDYISHTQIENIKLLDYDEIYLFSFSLSSIHENHEIIDKIPSERLIYISTIAVYSLLVRRQWAKYPIMKHKLEKYVFERGGRIVRLGVWADDNVNKISGKYQCTSKEELCLVLNGGTDFPKRILDLYHIREGGGDRQNVLRKYLDILDKVLPNFLVFKVPLIFLYRKLSCADYGYSKDAFSFCSAEVVVGEGCFGSAYLAIKGSNKIVVSPSGGLISWTDNGFRGTLISFRRYGLSELWHRVYVDRTSGNAVKRFDVRRHRHRAKRINSAVLGLDLETSRLKFGSPKILYDALSDYKAWDVDEALYYDIAVSKIILAAGTLVNGVLLNAYIETRECVYNDHKTVYLGDIEAGDVPRGFMRRFMCFVFHTSYRDYELNGTKLLIDYRPTSSENDAKIYLTSTLSIIIRLMSSLSVFRINEAFYNRFKFSFGTRRVGVWAQIEDKQCVIFDRKQFIRKDGFDMDAILRMMQQQHPSFKSAKSIEPIDSQHLVWSKTKMSKSYYHSLQSGKLQVLGSTPEGTELGFDHHTVSLRRSILKQR